MFDLSPSFFDNPYPFYASLRAIPGLYKMDGIPVASRYADVADILRSKSFGKAFDHMSVLRSSPMAITEPIFQCMRHSVLDLDPPDHRRVRGFIMQAFTAKRIEAMRPRIQRIVDWIIDRIEGDGEADLIARFAVLPETVICDILGIPQDDRPYFIGGAHIAARMLDYIPLDRAELNEQNRNILSMAAYCRDLFDERQCNPGDDLITDLMQACTRGDVFSYEELTANVLLLIGAGQETTVHLIGNGLLALYRNPRELRLLKTDPVLLSSAVEEMARYDAPVQAVGRCALEPVTVGGAAFEKGQPVICLLGSANRDPAVYIDPDRFDITRSHVHPLSFGGGIHYCIGAQLAHMQAQIAIGTLLRRLSTLQIDLAPPRRQALVFRGLTRLMAHGAFSRGGEPQPTPD